MLKRWLIFILTWLQKYVIYLNNHIWCQCFHFRVAGVFNIDPSAEEKGSGIRLFYSISFGISLHNPPYIVSGRPFERDHLHYPRQWPG